jgi:hypothetical protein
VERQLQDFHALLRDNPEHTDVLCVRHQDAFNLVPVALETPERSRAVVGRERV